MAHVFDRSETELSPWIRSEVQYVAPISTGANGKPVHRVQEWLNLHGRGVVVDGIFGPATAGAVRTFQGRNGLSGTGVVDEPTFDRLVAPMTGVLRQRLSASIPLGEAVLEYAQAHLAVHPREAGGPNAGPWVRLYMSGQQGAAFAWCASFVTFLLEQASRSRSASRSPARCPATRWRRRPNGPECACPKTKRRRNSPRDQFSWYGGLSATGHIPASSLRCTTTLSKRSRETPMTPVIGKATRFVRGPDRTPARILS